MRASRLEAFDTASAKGAPRVERSRRLVKQVPATWFDRLADAIMRGNDG
jgi:hypothetical protein